MNVAEFVTETLVAVAQGVSDANKRLGITYELRGKNSPGAAHVRFDIAVTTGVSAKGQATGKAGINVLAVATTGEAEAARQDVSRISFDVALYRDVHKVDVASA